MFAALHIAVDKDTEFVVVVDLKTAVNAGRVRIELLWLQQENVCLCTVCNVIHVFENVCPDACRFGICDENGVEVDSGTSLEQVSLTFHRTSGSIPHTSVMGVSFNILALILCTISASPDIQTFVTRAVSGPLCIPGTGLGLDDVTVACTAPPLASLILLHSVLKLSTFFLWTGSS